MTTIAMIQARMGSSRLPGKVLKDLAGKTPLAYVYSAAKLISGIDDVVVLTSIEESDDPIVDWCIKNSTSYHRGSLNDVLDRYYTAAKSFKADTIIRLTADCPLLDSNVVSQLLALFKLSECDYCSNVVKPTWPDGLDCEILSFSALEKAYEDATLQEDREHVTRYIHRNRALFRVKNMPCPIGDLSHYRWTLDTQKDFDFLSKLMKALPDQPSYTQVLEILRNTAELDQDNTKHEVARGFISQSQDSSPSFLKSKQILEIAEKTIPLGSQTFSKSRQNLAPGAAPLFATHGKGGRIWDVDGNEYVDMLMGLLPVTLGYADKDVDAAILAQLDNGISFSLATELEYKLSEKIISMVPSAEKVRFGKNGTDATSAAIRLSRAYTGRDHIIVCGYHGWQDWYIGATTRNKGIPDCISELTHKVNYNNLQQVEDILKAHDGQIAAMILEPMNIELPKEGYLASLKKLLHKHGAVFIFDEVITGFRYAVGGAQEYFDVIPDLTCLGKGMANGMPLSAITGRAEIMNEMENIFFSGTFGGEALSLAASIAVLEKIEREPVIDSLWKTGSLINFGLKRLVKEHDLTQVIDYGGLAPWHLMKVSAYDSLPAVTIKTFITHELFKLGILTLGSYNICYAHSQKDVDQLLQTHGQVFERLAQYIKNGNLADHMDYPAMKPVFEVRKTV